MKTQNMVWFCGVNLQVNEALTCLIFLCHSTIGPDKYKPNIGLNIF